MDNLFLGADIGGTSVKLGLIDANGCIHARHEASVCFDGYETPILQSVIRACGDFLGQTGQTVQAIGVSATGQIDSQLGKVIGTNGKIPHYEGAEIAREMQSAFAVPVRALNDANAAVLGECFAGRAKGLQNVVMLTLGTGVGGGIVAGGRLLEGARGIAGELGHLTLYPDSRPCGCGNHGCYEEYASATALVRRAAQIDPAISDGKMLFERATNGDAAMLDVLYQWLDDVAAGIVSLVHIFNPEMILIGGGISVQEQLLIQPLRRRVLARVMPRFGESLRIERAALGNDAGMIGAVKFCMDAL